jgi:ssDNA thymidine ADP-ribosyltransferase, DarT
VPRPDQQDSTRALDNRSLQSSTAADWTTITNRLRRWRLPRNLSTTFLYHITDVSNLESIIADGALRSDVGLANVSHQVIGYGNIKQRRMTEYRVPCCGNRFVGEFVPFYYCPRSPMLYTVNRGNTGRPSGCQESVVHLVTSVAAAVILGRAWAISDVNAGAGYATFSNDLSALDDLDWSAIRTNSWQGKMHLKQAEFLVADRFEWSSIAVIGCHNAGTEARVRKIMAQKPGSTPEVRVEIGWYYQ